MKSKNKLMKKRDDITLLGPKKRDDITLLGPKKRDDITLLGPKRNSVMALLDICSNYAHDNDIKLLVNLS